MRSRSISAAAAAGDFAAAVNAKLARKSPVISATRRLLGTGRTFGPVDSSIVDLLATLLDIEH
jgi:hypothetical protein